MNADTSDFTLYRQPGVEHVELVRTELASATPASQGPQRVPPLPPAEANESPVFRRAPHGNRRAAP